MNTLGNLLQVWLPFSIGLYHDDRWDETIREFRHQDTSTQIFLQITPYTRVTTRVVQSLVIR